MEICMSFFRYCLLVPTLLLALLSEDQINTFNRDGFLVLPDFVPEEACDALKARVEEMLSEFDPSTVKTIFDTSEQIAARDQYFLESASKIHFFFEKEAFQNGVLVKPKEVAINKIGHAMHDLDPVFNRFTRTEKLKNLTFDLGLKNPLLIQSMYIFKQPYIGGEVTCHQDATFIYSTPNTSIGYWIAIEDATLENGCLWAIPGGHLTPLKLRFVLKEGKPTMLTFDSSPWDLTPMIPLEVKKGTLIVLHGHVPHMSYANRSPKSRHAYTLHVVDSSSDYPQDNWLTRDPSFPFKGFD